MLVYSNFMSSFSCYLFQFQFLFLTFSRKYIFYIHMRGNDKHNKYFFNLIFHSRIVISFYFYIVVYNTNFLFFLSLSLSHSLIHLCMFQCKYLIFIWFEFVVFISYSLCYVYVRSIYLMQHFFLLFI